MSEKDKQNLQEKIDEKIMKSKKRNRSASIQNTSTELKRKKKQKTEDDRSTQNNNVLPISSFINENVSELFRKTKNEFSYHLIKTFLLRFKCFEHLYRTKSLCFIFSISCSLKDQSEILSLI